MRKTKSVKKTKSRKLEHIKICLNQNVQFREKTTGFERMDFAAVDLTYKALPEINKKEINTETKFLGKKFSAPLMVTAITGGVPEAKTINLDIAKACQALGLGMGLGSQRAMLEDKKVSNTYKVRDIAPDIFIAGNIGVLQIQEYSVSDIKWMLDEVEADALAIHINAAQEALQKDGATTFKGGLRGIKKLAKNLKKPVYVKEVGHGISADVAKLLSDTGIKAIDVAGAGGTSWIGVDSLRGNKESGEVFWDFGIPTLESLIQVKESFKGQIVASGGIRNGLEMAKALVLGADMCGIALPVLKAQNAGGSAGVEKYLRMRIEELKTAMFLTGAKNIKELKQQKVVSYT
ncbi:MAG: type 2 isopentenyl-diphosphate Delta-isomerase [Candidatus Diapherotrites archaeon]